MRKVLSLIIIISISFGSKVLLDVTYEQTQDKSFVKNIKPKQEIASYTTKNGSVIKIGSKLLLGSALQGNVQTTVNQGGLFGNSNSASSNAVFSTIQTGTFEGNIAMAFFGGQPIYLSASTTGEELVVEKISLGKSTMKRTSPRVVRIFAKNMNDGSNIVSGRTIMDLEKALLIGEIIDPNAPLTKSQAIAKLKESKDLLDLDIISKDEYEKLKLELTPIIRGK